MAGCNANGPAEIKLYNGKTDTMEQAVSAVPGVTRVESTSSEGNSQVRLNFTWGMDLNEAMNDMRTRLDRVRNRLPEFTAAEIQRSTFLTPPA